MIEFIVYSLIEQFHTRGFEEIYPVVAHKIIEVSEDLKPKTGDLVAILTSSNNDMLHDPNCDSLIAILPIVGKGQSSVYPTIIFWNQLFWIPVLDIYPTLFTIHNELFPDFDEKLFRVDVIHRISVF